MLKIFKRLKELNKVPEICLSYDREELARQVGKENGIAIGEELGKKRGIAIGEERGKKQGLEQRTTEFAKTMLQNNESIEKISKYTGLSIQKINNLKY